MLKLLGAQMLRAELGQVWTPQDRLTSLLLQHKDQEGIHQPQLPESVRNVNEYTERWR